MNCNSGKASQQVRGPLSTPSCQAAPTDPSEYFRILDRNIIGHGFRHGRWKGRGEKTDRNSEVFLLELLGGNVTKKCDIFLSCA